MNETDSDAVTLLLQQQWNNLRSLVEGAPVRFSTEPGVTREAAQKSLVRRLSDLSRTIQQRRKQR
jgi:hypothetical protein